MHCFFYYFRPPTQQKRFYLWSPEQTNLIDKTVPVGFCIVAKLTSFIASQRIVFFIKLISSGIIYNRKKKVQWGKELLSHSSSLPSILVVCRASLIPPWNSNVWAVNDFLPPLGTLEESCRMWIGAGGKHCRKKRRALSCNEYYLPLWNGNASSPFLVIFHITCQRAWNYAQEGGCQGAEGPRGCGYQVNAPLLQSRGA